MGEDTFGMGDPSPPITLADIKTRWDVPWGDEVLSIPANDDGTVPLESMADLLDRFTTALNDIAWLIERVEAVQQGGTDA